jgi:hypothetical protein
MAEKLMALMDAEEDAKFDDEDDEDSEEEKAKKFSERFAKKFEDEEGDARFAKAIGVVYKKMAKMQAKLAKLADDSKAYMSENEALRKFKADVEASKLAYEVGKTMEEVKASVELPKEQEEALMEESKKFSLANIDGWKNHVKAVAFECVKKDGKKSKEPEVIKYALTWNIAEAKKGDSLWG